jgi:hypothetical protein
MRNRAAACLAALGLLGFASAATASSHREAPAMVNDPAADNVDLYAWVDANGNLVIVADYIGLEMPDGGPNWARFSDDVLYEIHIARGPNSLDDAITYQFQFTTAPYAIVKQTTGMQPNQLVLYPNTKGLEFFAQLSGGGAFAQSYTVTKIVGGMATVISPPGGVKVPPPNVGPTTDQINGFMAGETYETHYVDTAGSSAIGILSNGEGRVFAGPRDDPF